MNLVISIINSFLATIGICLIIAWIYVIYRILKHKCNLCGKRMKFEIGDTHKECSDYEAFKADKP